MTADRADEAARTIFEEHRSLWTIGPLQPGLQPTTPAAGAAVQERLIALYEAEGERVAGWKVALTTPVMQQMVGIDRPCEGAIFASRIRHGRAELRRDDYVTLAVEAEIAVRLGSDLPAGGVYGTPESVAGAVDAVMTGIEIVDLRAADYARLSAPLLIADNAMNRGCVLAPPVTDWRGLDLASLRGRMTINGTVVGEGRGADVLGHPFAALAWLAGALPARGRNLRAGDIVLTGSIVTTKTLAAGDAVTAEVDGLGVAAVEVR